MATKKFFTKEVKIGITFVVAFALLYWGINFLKGINLFTPTNHYILRFERVDGLVVSNSVLIRGYKVGQVHEIRYDFSQPRPFTVTININDDVNLPQGTVAALFDESMLGGKGINLLFSDAASFHSAGDTLTTTIDPGMMGALADIIPTLSATIAHLDSLVLSLDDMVHSPQISTSLDNIERITADFTRTTRSLNHFMDHRLPRVIDQFDTTMTNLNTITTDLSRVNYTDIIHSIDSTVNNLNRFAQRINDPDGTVGLLLNDPALYRELTTTVSSANNLLLDLKANPKRYVHFSLFGRKDKDKNKDK